MEQSELAAIQACQKGDLTQFDPLYTAHIDAVYRFLYRRTLVREVAEDLTSTTFMKALEGIRSFNPSKGEWRAWLYRIARNALVDYYRSQHRTVSIENVWDLPSDEITSLATDKNIDAAVLHDALKKLKPLQREVVLLRIWEGLSYKDISRLLGKTEGNAKVLFSRAISELRSNVPAFALLLLFPQLV